VTEERAAFSGVGCIASGANERGRGYVFFVAAIGEVTGYALVRLDETDKSLREDEYFKYLADAASDVVADPGESNHIRGECRATEDGVNLAMFVTGKQVATASDPNGFHPFDGLAFEVLAPESQTDIRYDNFRAENIGSSE